MRVRKLILFTVMLACLFSASRSIAQGSDSQPSNETTEISKPANLKPDFNREIYYKNKLEFSFESGWHPINIPWVYDFAVGDSYNMTPLKYTLVPVIASLRWHVNDIGGPWILRGNFDFTFSGSVTLIPRGPETRYFVFIYGIRRNFVYRNWRIVPYFDERGGIGNIDAKEPLGVLFAQGQDLTFTYDIGAGVRYNFDPRYSISAGMNYMHISNCYLSEPRYTNYGINVYGPMFGIDIRLGKPHHDASQ
jgi:Lipid A 3-O-deacylase (PagL)